MRPFRMIPLAVLLLLGSCAPWKPAPVETKARVAYFAPPPANIVVAEETFPGAGDRELAYFRYSASGRRAQTACLYLNGIESHSGWFAGTAHRLAQAGFDVYCLDRRGSGINRENRGFASGDIDRHGTWLEDVRALGSRLRADYTRVHLVGLSWGGAQATATVLAYPGVFDSAILITPGIATRLEPGILKKTAILFWRVAYPGRAIATGIEPEMFSAQPDIVEKIRRDPERLSHVTARFLVEYARLRRFIGDHMDENSTPILLFLAGRDPIIDNARVRALLARGATPGLTIEEFEDQLHSIQFDAVERLATRITTWIGPGAHPIQSGGPP